MMDRGGDDRSDETPRAGCAPPRLTLVASCDWGRQARVGAALLAEFKRQAGLRGLGVRDEADHIWLSGRFDLAQIARAALAVVD